MSVLNEPVLVLSSQWSPIETCTVRKAFEKVFSEKAKIVDHDFVAHDFLSWAELAPKPGDPVIKTSQMNIRAPEIIVLTGHCPHRKKIAFSRRNLMKRDDHSCQYCGCRPSAKDLTMDHIVPKTRGGKKSWLNCVMSCFDCNSFKANRTPDEAGMKLINSPYEPKWSPVFRLIGTKHKESWSQFLSN